MSSADTTISSFISSLSSSSPAPGGGAAVAITAALSCSLVSMAVSATSDNYKYSGYHDSLLVELPELDRINRELLDLIDMDAECFEPLSRLYKLPKGSPERTERMHGAVLRACESPVLMLDCIRRVCAVLERTYGKVSKSIISDIKCAAHLSAAAARCAADTVYANTHLISGTPEAESIERKTEAVLCEICSITDSIICSNAAFFSSEVT